MNNLRSVFLGTALAALVAIQAVGGEVPTNTPPDFKEVYELIRSNLAGANEGEMNRAAVEGLLGRLNSRVSLVSSTADSNAAPEPALLTQSSLLEGGIGYVRVGRVGQGLGDHVSSTVKKITGTSLLKGVILDLRYGTGHDYAAAAGGADIFIAKETPLLDWGNGYTGSKAKADAITVPLVVLVNRETAAAAEALAAVLRESAKAVILGSTTAGEATIGKDFPLKNGQYLRIATASIKLADGGMLTAAGIKPDILVAVKPEDEKAYFADAYKEPPASSLTVLGGGSATNRPPRARTSEADLIRERMERPGMELGSGSPSAAKPEPDKPVVRDPVLARAMDLVKGISALRPARTP